jgi:DNA modification methylase
MRSVQNNPASQDQLLLLDEKQRAQLLEGKIAMLRGEVHVLADGQRKALPEEFFSKRSHDSAIVIGDSAKVLKEFPANVFQTCVTSPPYWSLRDYKIPGQIGLEQSLQAYIDALVNVFEEVRRTLRQDGTLWLNIGDSYTSGGRTWRAPDKKNPVRAMTIRPPTPTGLKPKDLIGIPWRIAFALQEAGWYLRTDLVWHKPNCQPESVKDRPTRSHEYIFLFSKDEKYFYDHTALRGPNGRNLRTVWNIKTQASKAAHFAMFPPNLVAPCVTLSTKRGDILLDPFLGSGTTGLVSLALARRFVGVELNPDYISIAERRISRA